MERSPGLAPVRQQYIYLPRVGYPRRVGFTAFPCARGDTDMIVFNRTWHSLSEGANTANAIGSVCYFSRQPLSRFQSNGLAAGTA